MVDLQDPSQDIALDVNHPWLLFEEDIITLSGLVPAELSETSTRLRLTATDEDGLTAWASFSIVYSAKPVVSNPISNFFVRTFNTWRYTLPDTVFSHPDKLDFEVFIYNIPDWVTYDNETTTFTGLTTEDEIGEYTINVVAVDTLGARTSETFDIFVLKNFLPVVNNQLEE